MKLKTIACAIAGLTFGVVGVADACTSIAWQTDEYGVFTSRTNDWIEPSTPYLGTINKGDERSINGIDSDVTYTVKNDIVAVLAYGKFVHDGMNDKGLQVNTLYYTPMTMNEATSPAQISQFTFGEYILANFDNVESAVNHIKDMDYASIKIPSMPKPIKLHWSLTDQSGDRAVVELDADGVQIYRGEDAMVMTNQPSMKTHLKNLEKWKPNYTNSDKSTDFGSKGNLTAESRFLHASYYLSKLEKPTSTTNALMQISTVPFQIPYGAPYEDYGHGMAGYATEWTINQSLDTGDTVFEYKYGDYWNEVRYNVYDLMGKTIYTPLYGNKIAELL